MNRFGAQVDRCLLRLCNKPSLVNAYPMQCYLAPTHFELVEGYLRVLLAELPPPDQGGGDPKPERQNTNGANPPNKTPFPNGEAHVRYYTDRGTLNEARPRLAAWASWSCRLWGH
jgi:hypothetical protein